MSLRSGEKGRGWCRAVRHLPPPLPHDIYSHLRPGSFPFLGLKSQAVGTDPESSPAVGEVRPING